jgi:hypothetical protein
VSSHICNAYKFSNHLQRYVLPINRHCYPIAITEDDPTRYQLPIGGLFSGASPPKWLAYDSSKYLLTYVACAVFFLIPKRKRSTREVLNIYSRREFLALSHVMDGHSTCRGNEWNWTGKAGTSLKSQHLNLSCRCGFCDIWSIV